MDVLFWSFMLAEPRESFWDVLRFQHSKLPFLAILVDAIRMGNRTVTRLTPSNLGLDSKDTFSRVQLFILLEIRSSHRGYLKNYS
jgi:hypothetical protein